MSGLSLASHGTMFGEMSQKYMTTAHYRGSVVATKNISAKNIRKEFKTPHRKISKMDINKKQNNNY